MFAARAKAKPLLTAAILGLVFCLSGTGCGQKGPLKHPESEPAQSSTN